MVKVELAGGDVRKNTAEVGAHIPVGVGLIRMSYAVLDDRSDDALRNANGSARSGNDARQFGLGYVHNLSKRTALYTSYARLKQPRPGRLHGQRQPGAAAGPDLERPGSGRAPPVLSDLPRPATPPVPPAWARDPQPLILVNRHRRT